MYTLQSKRPRSRTTVVVLAGCAVVVLIGAVAVGPRAWQWTRGRYLQAKQERALKQAKTYLAARDPAAAAAAIQVALAARPGSVTAWRTAADLVEQAGVREALHFRRRVVELEPEQPLNRLALAQTAVRFQDYATAYEAFTALPDDLRKSVEAERVALALSLAGQAAPMADALFSDLESKSPADPNLAFSHTLLLLRHPKSEQAARARRAVETFAKQPQFQLPALRELYLDAVARREPERALQIAHQLAAAPGAALGDKLSAANADLIYGKVPLDRIQPGLAAQAAAAPDDAVQFAQWLVVQRRSDEARTWISQLPAAIGESGPVRSLKAEWALRDRDWETLQTLVRQGAWGPIIPAALQLAVSASLLGTNENDALRAKVWQEAVGAARGDLSSLRILNRLAAAWAWPNENLQVLVAISQQFPTQTWAHDARISLCRRLKDTRGMLAGIDQWRRVDTLSDRLRYNGALLEELLSGASLPENAPSRLALNDLLARHPEDASYRTGAAFALAKSGRTAEAVKLLDVLSARAAELPARAPYLAYVYAMGLKFDQASACLLRAQGTDFLPEEAALLEQAQMRVSSPKLFKAKAKDRGTR